MNNFSNLTQKSLEQLYWLESMDIDFYCSQEKRVKSVINTLINNSQNKEIAKQTMNHTQSIKKIIEKDPNNEQNNLLHEARKLADSATTLEDLKQIVTSYNGCKLKEFASNIVFADGNPNSEIMLIGEAPGATEDKLGIPFCGESGKLLDSMLRSINVSRSTNCYITNTIFWRPPANRVPSAEEIELCKPFVEKHIALISPKLIVMVGNTAATSLLGPNIGITKIRQEYFSYSNQYLETPILCTAIFHPAYLLRQPMQKKTSWYDLIKIKTFIDNRMMKNII